MSIDPQTTPTTLRNHWWWRPGWRADRTFYTWHLTFEGQDDLHRLVTTYQTALADVAGLDFVPLRWLHLTTQGVGFTDEVSRDDITAIADAGAERLAKLAPAVLTFHHAVARTEALALPPAPQESLIAIRDAIREAIADVWGADHIPEANNVFDPHLSVAYVNADGPAVPAQAALVGVQAEPVRVAISEASLIVLQRDGHLYHWDTFAASMFSGIH